MFIISLGSFGMPKIFELFFINILGVLCYLKILSIRIHYIQRSIFFKVIDYLLLLMVFKSISPDFANYRNLNKYVYLHIYTKPNI